MERLLGEANARALDRLATIGALREELDELQAELEAARGAERGALLALAAERTARARIESSLAWRALGLLRRVPLLDRLARAVAPAPARRS